MFDCILFHLIFQNKLGDTPLHSAAWRGHSDAVRLLLESGMTGSQNNIL